MGYSLMYVRPCAGKRVPLERDPGRYLDPAGQVVERNQHWLRRIAAGDVEECTPPAPPAAVDTPSPETAPELEPVTPMPEPAPEPEPQPEAQPDVPPAPVKPRRNRTRGNA